jgi:hypothetical protein
MIGHLVPAGRQEVEASTDQPGGKGPEGDLVNEFARAALTLPPTRGNRDRGEQTDEIHQPVDADLKRPEVNAIRRGARDRGEQCGLLARVRVRMVGEACQAE